MDQEIEPDVGTGTSAGGTRRGACLRSWYEELAADHVRVRDVVNGLATAMMVEDYPDYAKGPCVLVLEHDEAGQPIHVVWGIPLRQNSPAVVVTAYRPDPAQWDETWRKRRT